MLRKTWRLTRIRSRQVQHLACSATRAKAEVRSLGERAAREEAARIAAESDAARGEQVHELLESTMSRLSAARKALKEREMELEAARQRADRLERDRLQQDQKLRQLESIVQRETWARNEAERRVSEARSEADAEAAQQRGELRRRLSVAELALGEANEELVNTEQRGDEARANVERRYELLEADLAESRREREELERRLMLLVATPMRPQTEDVPPGASGAEDGMTNAVLATPSEGVGHLHSSSDGLADGGPAGLQQQGVLGLPRWSGDSPPGQTAPACTDSSQR